ncbi:MAG: hypothetical protein CVT92_06280 [Bacteroidetes bacterium HGW-Bacteroidetes-1]|jgi:aminopeptidase N|nr:MAG: hypothetical protein CVT92_06280 [Bacteroidetes bacterium HGW-Bacteroidetes-1]
MFKLRLIIYLLLIFGSNAQVYAQCNHRHGFSHSPVADSIDAIHYRIHIQQIDFVLKKIQAKALITLRPRVSLSQISLELKDLIVDSVFVNNLSAAFSQQDELLHIQSGQIFHPDDTLTAEIFYNGTPFHEQWGGFHFSGNYAFNLGVGFVSNPHNLGKAWFPCVDDFQDRATYEVLITLPDDMTGIAGGVLVGTTNHGNGYKTWHWSLDQPIPTYLASVAVGNYALTSDTYQGIQSALPITIYTRPADTLKVEGSFQNLQQVLASYESRFGPYPFDRVGYTGTAIGAMEHVTNIAYPHQAINGNLSSEYLLAHELSHMWFGNLVTCAEEGDMWLNEGWATFCHHFFRYDLYGEAQYRLVMNENHYDVLKNAHITDGSYLSLQNVPTEYTYGTTVYDKGATVIHTLMNYLGQEVFFDAVKAYLQQYSFNHADSYNLRDALSVSSGIDLTGFFDAWVFTPGTPHFSIDSLRVSLEGKQYNAHVFLRQKYKGYEYLADNNILEITFIGANWQKLTDTVHFSGRNGHSMKTMDFEPIMVLMDFYDKTADATTDVDGVIHQTGQIAYPTMNFRLFVDTLSDSAFYRVTHHWAAPDSLKTPVNGLRLSPYRHWEFQGIFPEDISMRGRFFYSNTSSLDASLILSEQDSVVILYRANTARDWQIVPQTREGLWSVGYILVNDFQPGQYTLAVWDKQIVGEKEFSSDTLRFVLNAVPNPSKAKIKLSWMLPSSGIVTVVDTNGKIVFQKQVHQESYLEIDTSNWMKGIYFADMIEEKGFKNGFVKFILQ